MISLKDAFEAGRSLKVSAILESLDQAVFSGNYKYAEEITVQYCLGVIEYRRDCTKTWHNLKTAREGFKKEAVK